MSYLWRYGEELTEEGSKSFGFTEVGSTTPTTKQQVRLTFPTNNTSGILIFR